MPPANLNQRKVSYFNIMTLLLANGFAVWQFAVSHGSILQVLWVYWFQSVVIGLVNVGRILLLPIRLPGFPISLQNTGATIGPSRFEKIIRVGTAGFFAFHYGFFHLIYAIFLLSFGASHTMLYIGNTPTHMSLGAVSAGLVLLNGIVFLIHHTSTLWVESAQLKLHPEEAADIGQVMKRPYRRIIPMHLIIILGPFVSVWVNNTAVFGLFIALKILVDMSQFYKGTSHPGNISAATTTPVQAPVQTL